MSLETALAACAQTVRRTDPDRYIAALFAPSERRPLLFALYAFNHELAHIGETVKEPMAGAIRLEWWREAVEGARDGHPRPHDVAHALAEVFARTGVPIELFDAMIAARQFDVGRDERFASLEALEAYADATAGNLARLSARVLEEHVPDDAQLGHAGTAYALAGLLRAADAHAARGKSFLPQEGGMAAVIAAARAHHAAAADSRFGPALPAALPAALVPLYAQHVAKHGLSRAPEIPLFRRQWVMLRAAMRGRV